MVETNAARQDAAAQAWVAVVRVEPLEVVSDDPQGARGAYVHAVVPPSPRGTAELALSQHFRSQDWRVTEVVYMSSFAEWSDEHEGLDVATAARAALRDGEVRTVGSWHTFA